MKERQANPKRQRGCPRRWAPSALMLRANVPEKKVKSLGSQFYRPGAIGRCPVLQSLENVGMTSFPH
jgi:hypothetical protein